MEVSCEFQRKGKVYGETSQLSFYCYAPSGTGEETSDGNHGTRQHRRPHNVHSPHLQTFGWLSYMHRTGTRNFGSWQDHFLAEGQDNEKVATRRCYSSHYNIDKQSLHQGKLGYISAI